MTAPKNPAFIPTLTGSLRRKAMKLISILVKLRAFAL
jgi:hypothetical protein